MLAGEREEVVVMVSRHGGFDHHTLPAFSLKLPLRSPDIVIYEEQVDSNGTFRSTVKKPPEKRSLGAI